MNVGVFGGSFDPVHLGHLILAEICREAAGLDRVLFLPAPRPPHKDESDLTPLETRVEMLQLAISGQPAFAVEDMEKDRPGPSFTADTLEELHRRRPEDHLFLLLGSDSLLDLPRWYDPQRILRLATLLVAARPGYPLPDLDALRADLNLPEHEPLRLLVAEVPLIDISATALRRRIREGRTIRYQVPRAVEAYLRDKNLYAG